MFNYLLRTTRLLAVLILAAAAITTNVPVFAQPAPATAAAGSKWEKTIQAIEAADQTNPPPKGATLFVGASNIRRWETLAADFKSWKVINRGFGGSQLKDVLQYTDRIVLPYAPKEIVLQAGGNDLNAGRAPSEVLTDFKAFVAKVHAGLPQTRLSVLSIPPSAARWSQVEKIRETNRSIADVCEHDPLLSFIDLFPVMLGADGLPRAELFVEDKLHANAQGYALWTSLIRWDTEIKKLLATDQKNPPPKNAILFIGSSSIRRWTNVAQAFPEHRVINHGFGGSQLADSVAFADQLVMPCQPKQIVMYAGSNDINAVRTPEQVFADFQAFVKKVRTGLPQTRIAYISIAPNPARWAQLEQIKTANGLIEKYCRENKLTFINVFPQMLGSDGQPKPDIFVEDRLHMNPKGYAIWTEVIRPYLN